MYENGQVEHWSISGSRVVGRVKVEPEQFNRGTFIGLMNKYTAESDIPCAEVENTNFFLNTIEANLKKRSQA